MRIAYFFLRSGGEYGNISVEKYGTCQAFFFFFTLAPAVLMLIGFI